MDAKPTTDATQWTGATSSDWTVGGNWSTGAVPTAAVDVRIDESAHRAVLGVTNGSVGVCGALWVGSATGAESSLIVQSGSSLTASDLYIGDNGGQGVVALDTGATLITTSAALIGVFDPNGAQPEDGVTGSVKVKGRSRWTANGVSVGSGGSGSLVVFQGSTVTTTSMDVALSEGSTGDVLIEDGGTLETSVLALGSGTGRIVFDGATLRATGGLPDQKALIAEFRSGDAEIGGGGLTIDDGGFVACVRTPLSGVGWLTKTGSGTLVLCATNTYQSGTSVEAGTLQIGDDDGTDGRVLGDVALAADTSLIMSYADTPFGGLISGGGRVRLRSGVIFLRDQTYTGGTTISGGTLVLGHNGPQGSIVGNVVVEDQGTLYFWRSDSCTFDGAISGTGRVIKDGATVTLTGHSTYTGATTILNGTLLVNGSIASPTTVNAGGTLGGTGRVASDVATAGSIAPGGAGADVGTLTIDGDCTFDGGTLAIKVKLGSDASPADLLRITGDALAGGGRIQVIVTNLDGEGAETTGDGIRIVEVGGTSAAGLFVLDTKITVGPHVYDLFHGGVTDPNDGNWYLRTVATAAPAHDGRATGRTLRI